MAAPYFLRLCFSRTYGTRGLARAFSRFWADSPFFLFFGVDFLPGLRYLESPDSTLLRCGQKAAASKLGTNAVLPVSRLQVMPGAFLFCLG